MNTRIILQVGSGSPNYLATMLDKWVSASASFEVNNPRPVPNNTFGKILYSYGFTESVNSHMMLDLSFDID